MLDLTSLLAQQGFLPHGYCFTWSPSLVWPMVAADALIALSYFSIPLAILTFMRKRQMPRYRGVAVLFAAFIFVCGVTHVMDVWTIWRPDYGWQLLVKIITAALSMVTAVALWPLIPRALRIPSVELLEQTVSDLQHEVNRRVTAEQHLQDLDRQLAVAVARIGAGFISCDRSGRVQRMNAVAEQITGWSQAEAQGHAIAEVFKRADGRDQHSSYNPVERLVLTSRDGAHTPVEVRSDVTCDEAGQVMGLVMLFTDLTQQNKAEAEQMRLASIVENCSDAIISKTINGRITSWNPAATQIFGYTAQEAVGEPITMIIPPDRMHEEVDILKRITAGETVPPFETLRRAKSGDLITVVETISPVRDASGQVIGASKVARDLSHLRRAEAVRMKLEKIESENQQILETQRIKNQFLANMSHELRTPLNAIIGFSDLLRAGSVPTTSPKFNEFLGHISSSGHHLLQLINDVLDLSKIEAGKFEFHPERVDLAVLASSTVNLLQPLIERKGLSIDVQISSDLVELYFDEGRMKQVLLNYLSNAVKFTPEGGRITLRAQPEGADYFRIEVEDTGIGIAESDLDRLFVEFQQLDEGYTKRYSGTGLGLALTRKLIEAQGGWVGVHSTLGRGSVFHFVLKRDLRPSESTAPSATPIPAEGARVLVIEDDNAHRDQLAEGLSNMGFEVDATDRAEAALSLAQQTRYDGISLDLKLPDGDGLNLLDGIRTESESRDSSVVAMTLSTTD
ncbi:MAG TPA: PAS domain S-box protein, partial [Aquabacterium sp.]|nr:PAS domain S-box protein [Aquabacterium sp.]